MGKDKYKEFQEYLEGRFKKWSIILGITDVRFVIWAYPFKGNKSMDVEYRYPYKRAWIRWSYRDYLVWKGRGTDADYLETAVLHECIHVVLWELVQKLKSHKTSRRELVDTEEKTTDHITNVIWAIIKNYPKDKSPQSKV